MKKNRIALAAAIIFLTITASGFADNSALRLGLVLIDNPQEDPAVEALCETATDTIELTLRLVNRYRVERLDFLLPTVYPQRSEIYLKKNNFDHAVYGEIFRTEDEGYRFIINCWERETDSVTINLEAEADSIFDTFDIVDDLSTDFIEQLSGEHIGYGRVLFRNAGLDTDYNIYVDGIPLGRNLKEAEVLYGKREFKITRPGSLGDTEIETILMEIPEGRDTDVVFSIDQPHEKSVVQKQDETPVGNLYVESHPPGAGVLLDNQHIGTAPMWLYGIETGLYELSLTEEYFLKSSEVVNIETNTDSEIAVKLQLDIEHPDIQAQLGSSLIPEISAAGITIIQLLLLGEFIGLDYFNSVNYNPAGLFFASIRYGHFFAGDELMGSILSAVSVSSVLLLRYSAETYYSSGAAGKAMNWAGIIGLVGSVLWDLIGTPIAVADKNEEKIAGWQDEGFSPDSSNAEFEDFRLSAQAGGGGLFHAGISWRGLSGWLGAEGIIGIAYAETSEAGDFSFPLTLKLHCYPFPKQTNHVTPYLGGNFILSYDLDRFSPAAGIHAGIEIELFNMEFFIEGGTTLYNRYGTMPAVFAAGVRV